MGDTTILSVTLPDTITVIDGGAFWGCSSLESINLPRGLLTIGNGAFAECTALDAIVIPQSVSYIAEYAFNLSVSLTIYCEAPSQPGGWHDLWNSSNLTVIWEWNGKQ